MLLHLLRAKSDLVLVLCLAALHHGVQVVEVLLLLPHGAIPEQQVDVGIAPCLLQRLLPIETVAVAGQKLGPLLSVGRLRVLLVSGCLHEATAGEH